ncbi:MAG: ATP-dependent helicase [candidate division KSB1 bacterium]|nr:ATP-dependent helicase [candidate division KSB1 bacterium]
MRSKDPTRQRTADVTTNHEAQSRSDQPEPRDTREQQCAVRHLRGPVCVVAGAGTGKTKTLCDRILFLIKDCQLDPGKILVTTFTRKATAQLYQRTYEQLGEMANRLRITTIDAFVSDLAMEAANRGAMPRRRLIGEAESRVLLLEAAWEAFGQKRCAVPGWSDSPMSRTKWASGMDRVGLVGLLEDALRLEVAEKGEKSKLERQLRRKLREKEEAAYLQFSPIPSFRELRASIKHYLAKLDKLGVRDYDLLSREFLHLLRRRRDLARELGSTFSAILVDEFQDTSRTQAEILLHIAGRGKNLWVVGDPCQQIYEWRGAAPANIQWFVRKTRARRYYLTANWRSTQPILDSAYTFLRRRVPKLATQGMLKRLQSRRGVHEPHPVYSGNLDQALCFVRQLLDQDSSIVAGDIAILSRKLDKTTISCITEKAEAYGLNVQLYSSRADRTMERIIGDPPFWKPGTALENLYAHSAVCHLVSQALRVCDFSTLRDLRPLAIAVDATDGWLSPASLTLREAWPALKKTQDREIDVTSAVQNRRDAIQVMTIHAAKGLEFPIVLLMKIGKSFPSKLDEEARLAYVGATRARDVLVLVHIKDRPRDLLAEFGEDVRPLRRNRREPPKESPRAPAVLSTPPIIAATHLDLYEECPLKFAAFHEGRYLSKWSVPQSIGVRMHKALELLLREGVQDDLGTVDAILQAGIREGDAPFRKLSAKIIERMKKAFRLLASSLASRNAVLVEHRYRYLQGTSGQVDGVIDAVLEEPGGMVLKEWKTSSDIARVRKRQYELQARSGALGLLAQGTLKLKAVEIVPVMRPEQTMTFHVDGPFVQETQKALDGVFKVMRDRSYQPQRGPHCSSCQLKPHCPAWKQ